MIRTSAAIGVAALILSIVVHVLGLVLTIHDTSSPQTSDQGVEQIAVSDTFEELADVQLEPVKPEMAETPEPPVETPPEPEQAEATSQAMVASDSPQNVSAPDRGTVREAQPTVSNPVTPVTAEASRLEINTSPAGTGTVVADARITPPVAVQTHEPALGSPEASAATIPPVSPLVAPEPVTAPTAGDPTAPVAKVPMPDVLAALPQEVVSPEERLAPVESEEEASDENGSAERATSSLRPKIRPQSLSDQPPGTVDGTANAFDGLRRPTELIESPLTAHKRDGVDLFSGQQGGAQSGGSLGPGNSNETNYAGEVLMHLNRVRPVAVSARGWVRVVFRIEPDGSLALVNIIDGSGSSEIEAAAKEHVRRGVPFPRPPDNKSRLLNFIYQIQ